MTCWSPRALEHSISALEHLRAFASPLGVKLLVENLQGDVARPEHLVEILSAGHFRDIGVCFDVGHAHLGEGVTAALSELNAHVRSTHLHDNKRDKDNHLWPGDGTINWDEALSGLKAAPQTPAGVLEIHYLLGDSVEAVEEKAKRAFEKMEAARG